MRRIALGLGFVAAAVAVAAAWWRRHPRVGSAYMNRVVNPWLMERGLAEKSEGEIGLLEHVGRSWGPSTSRLCTPFRSMAASGSSFRSGSSRSGRGT